MLRLIENNNITDPFVNLSLEEYCVRKLDMKDDYLLFYINEPSIIIGKHQNTIEEKTLTTDGLTDEELDIDLLTENGSNPDEKNFQVVQQHQTNENVVVGVDENSIKDIESNESESHSNCANETDNTSDRSKTPVPLSPSPKLTLENITKYVINRSKLKIKNADTDVKSSDLNL